MEVAVKIFFLMACDVVYFGGNVLHISGTYRLSLQYSVNTADGAIRFL
jgi:hypothetical protein